MSNQALALEIVALKSLAMSERLMSFLPVL